MTNVFYASAAHQKSILYKKDKQIRTRFNQTNTDRQQLNQITAISL